jgi:cytosine/adenosine deaminase-related metal-dependent hydrolase
MTLTDETLAACVAAVPAGTSFHVHIAEHPVDQEDSHRRSGRRVVERLARAGVLGPRSIAAHCIHIDPWEMALLRDTGTWITHQPRSNMNNAVGAADISSMLRGGMPVCLGNDGFSNDMFAEMKAAYLLHKVWQGDPRVAGGWEVMSLAYTHNARLAGLFFPSAPLGEISPGALADLIFLDYHPPTPLTAENLPWHAIFGMHGGQVTTTICAGRALMRDRQLTTLDEVAIAARARELAREVWKRIL